MRVGSQILPLALLENKFNSFNCWAVSVADSPCRFHGSQRRLVQPASLVRGGFGEDEADGLFPDTRWVELSELVSNMDDKDLAKLDTFASGLKKTLQAARKRLRTASATADESDD